MTGQSRRFASYVAVLVVVLVLIIWDKSTDGSSGSYADNVVSLDSCQIGVYFSPRGGCPEAIVSAIDNAERTIDGAIYTFTSREIAQALVRAYERGISVRIIMDRNQAADGYAKKRYLSNKGIPVRVHIGDGIMHNKFLVVDSTIVITGSFNWTASADRWNYENIVVIKSSALAQIYEAQFGKLWKKFE